MSRLILVGLEVACIHFGNMGGDSMSVEDLYDSLTCCRQNLDASSDRAVDLGGYGYGPAEDDLPEAWKLGNVLWLVCQRYVVQKAEGSLESCRLILFDSIQHASWYGQHKTCHLAAPRGAFTQR
jgi:hypothetical protein